MCIGVPGQVLAVGEDIHQLAQVEVCGIKRDVNIALICEGTPADLQRAGFFASVAQEEENPRGRGGSIRRRPDKTRHELHPKCWT